MKNTVITGIESRPEEGETGNGWPHTYGIVKITIEKRFNSQREADDYNEALRVLLKAGRVEARLEIV